MGIDVGEFLGETGSSNPSSKTPNLRPLCPLCEKKKMLFSKVTGAVGNGWEGCFAEPQICFWRSGLPGCYSCPGYFDEEAKHFRKCKAHFQKLLQNSGDS